MPTQSGYTQIKDLLETLRKAQTDLQNIEVKEAAGGVPKTLADSVSALTNGSGGVVVLGLSERQGFVPVEGFSAKSAMDALADICSNKLTPPVRAQISVEQVDGANIVVADIPETAPQDKPCYVSAKGMYKGSFIRTGDGDRLLTAYEINRLAEERQQPRYDEEIVAGAKLEDLDSVLLDRALEQQRTLHSRIFADMPREKLLESLGVVTRQANGKSGISLAGLLAFGMYPQHFEPRLSIAFTHYPSDKQSFTGPDKYQEARSIVGAIPYLIADTIAAIEDASPDGLIFPKGVLKEVLCNALMHRDYSMMGRGMQAQVNLYADRLEVISPGGLYGAVTKDTMGEVGISATRNLTLASLLETAPYPDGGFVAENNSGGMRRLTEELQESGLPAPEVIDKPSYLTVILRKSSGSTATSSAGKMAVQGFSSSNSSGTQSQAPYNAQGKVTSEVFSLRGSSLLVYSALAELGEARTSDVVKATGISRSTVCYALATLVARGFAEVVDGSNSLNSPQRKYRVAPRK